MTRGGSITALALLCIGGAVVAGWFLCWYSQLLDITEMRLAMEARHLRENHSDEIWTFDGRVAGSSPHGYSLLTPMYDAPNAGVFIVTSPSFASA
jgi:hypothetical protein